MKIEFDAEKTTEVSDKIVTLIHEEKIPAIVAIGLLYNILHGITAGVYNEAEAIINAELPGE